MGNFKEDIVKTEAFIFDVDGVLTDGGIIPTLDGDFIRKYNAKDGYAIAYAIRMGYKVCIITGGRGENLRHRLEMLHIEDMYLDCSNKIAALEEYCAKNGIDPENVIYMGDDIPDLECMRRVGHRGAGAAGPGRLGEGFAGRHLFAVGRFGLIKPVRKQITEERGNASLSFLTTPYLYVNVKVPSEEGI